MADSVLPVLETGELHRESGANGGTVKWARFGAIVVLSVECDGSFSKNSVYHLASGLPAAIRPRVRAVGSAITESAAGRATVYLTTDGNVYGADITETGTSSVRGTIVYALGTTGPLGVGDSVDVPPNEVFGDLTRASGISWDADYAALGPIVTVQVAVKSSNALDGDVLLASGVPSRLRPVNRAYGFVRLGDTAVGVCYVNAVGEVRVTRPDVPGTVRAHGTVTYIATGGN